MMNRGKRDIAAVDGSDTGHAQQLEFQLASKLPRSDLDHVVDAMLQQPDVASAVPPSAQQQQQALQPQPRAYSCDLTPVEALIAQSLPSYTELRTYIDTVVTQYGATNYAPGSYAERVMQNYVTLVKFALNDTPCFWLTLLPYTCVVAVDGDANSFMVAPQYAHGVAMSLRQQTKNKEKYPQLRLPYPRTGIVKCGFAIPPDHPLRVQQKYHALFPRSGRGLDPSAPAWFLPARQVDIIGVTPQPSAPEDPYLNVDMLRMQAAGNVEPPGVTFDSDKQRKLFATTYDKIDRVYTLRISHPLDPTRPWLGDIWLSLRPHIRARITRSAAAYMRLLPGLKLGPLAATPVIPMLGRESGGADEPQVDPETERTRLALQCSTKVVRKVPLKAEFTVASIKERIAQLGDEPHHDLAKMCLAVQGNAPASAEPLMCLVSPEAGKCLVPGDVQARLQNKQVPPRELFKQLQQASHVAMVTATLMLWLDSDLGKGAGIKLMAGNTIELRDAIERIGATARTQWPSTVPADEDPAQAAVSDRAATGTGTGTGTDPPATGSTTGQPQSASTGDRDLPQTTAPTLQHNEYDNNDDDQDDDSDLTLS